MLSKSIIEDVLNEALATGGDFAEMFIEDSFSTGLFMVAGQIESGISGRDYGIGIRILNGTNSVYAYTNDSSKENLIRVAKQAAAAIQKQNKIDIINLEQISNSKLHKIEVLPSSIDKKRKVNLVKQAYHSAKNYDDCISQVRVRYLDKQQDVMIANTEGLMIKDRRVRTRTMIQTVASKNGEMQSGYYGPGAHSGFEFYDTIKIADYGKEAARIAKTMLNAQHCPSGKIPVIIDNKFGGVIFHEACGHGLEATSVAKGTSIFTNKLGQKIAADIVTAIDDGTIPNAWGSQNIDDEGNRMKKNLLIENGILKGYLVDKLNGRRMSTQSTSSARRQSYKFAPTSRMTNTYIANGKSTKEEIISNTEYGLYAKYMGGGSVNPATGDFNFAVMEGYIVRNGKIQEPVRGATLIGNGGEVLKHIDMVGNNLDFGQGMCGSSSGSIPTNVGQPTIRVKSMTVGGRKVEK